MRRELKAEGSGGGSGRSTNVAKHIPMRRELKDLPFDAVCANPVLVAKHIPMRRELKVLLILIDYSDM